MDLTVNDAVAQYLFDVAALALLEGGIIGAALTTRALWRWIDDLEYRFADWRRSRRPYPYPEDAAVLESVGLALAPTGITLAEAARSLSAFGEALKAATAEWETRSYD